MTTLPHAVAGDVNDFRTVILNGVEDLDTVTAIETHIWRPDTAAVVLTTAVTDSDARIIRFELGGALGWLATVATPNAWFVEYQLTFADGTILTWPQKTPDVLLVRAEAA